MKKLTLYICIILGLTSCIDPYEDFTINQARVLVVEALLTDDYQHPDTIKIQYQTAFDNYTKIETIDNTKASIFTSTGQEIKLEEKRAGKFLPPKDFRIKAGEKYTFKFNFPDGQQYESLPQQVVQTPSIDRTYDVFNPKSQQNIDGTRFISGNDVYVDFQDKANERNFYIWRSIHYESIEYCASCDYDALFYTFFTDPRTGNRYVNQCVSRNLIIAGPIEGPPYGAYDYVCGGDNCFNIYCNKKEIIFSDISSDGRLVKGIKVAQIPNYSIKGCLVVVQQISVSNDIFRFYKLLGSQLQETGGLADTPPEAIVGNIRNLTNASERVVGVFGVVNIQEKRHWIDRKTAIGSRVFILGYNPRQEPSTGPSRPPLAPCKESSTRTGKKPEGWRD
jgi:hypothetical protein